MFKSGGANDFDPGKVAPQFAEDTTPRTNWEVIVNVIIWLSNKGCLSIPGHTDYHATVI
jgi:hypothetical protein